jgi:hypothetical protein
LYSPFKLALSCKKLFVNILVASAYRFCLQNDYIKLIILSSQYQTQTIYVFYFILVSVFETLDDVVGGGDSGFAKPQTPFLLRHVIAYQIQNFPIVQKIQ